MSGLGPEGVRSLTFRVLGPLEVWRDGDPVRLGGERQRALLALLLLHVNELVSTDQLVETLFASDRSENALNAVRVAVSRLRRLLEDREDGGILITRPRGYLLRTTPEQLDVALFERLLREGRARLTSGDAESAAATLREALALWRGPALADLSLMEFVQPEIRRLEELRLVALMERIDADLALGRSAELIPEIEAMVASNPLQERLRGQLMLALYRAGRQADALEAYRQTRTLLSEELGLEPSRALQELERAILQQDSSLDLAPARKTGRAPARTDRDEFATCPFKGLAFFDRSDAEFFCGLERVVADLVTRLAAATLVGVVGPSGIGKSSVLRAGLLPALARGVLPGSERWAQLLLRPGEHPKAELARVLEAEDIGAFLRQVAPGERIVLAVDQLEEVFTVCEQEAERVAFFEELVTAASDHDRRVMVILSLRADFYGRCAAFPRFAELLSRSHALIGPMDRDELARAIELPASRAGLEVERSLVDALVADVVGEPGGLPMLSTTLLELWGDRDDRVLRYRSYRRSGGVRGAVARLAEDAYTRLSAEEQAVARAIMLRLATGEEGSLVRRRVPLAELERIDGAERVLAVLTVARLLTVSDGEVEVSHEALLREWPRYRAWLEEDREGRRLHVHLGASAREWAQGGRDSADLYRGARLVAALEWVARHQSELNDSEWEFAEASRVEAERESGRQRRQNRRLRGLLGGVLALLTLAIAAGAVALVQRNNASAAARVALARQLGAEAVIQPRIDLAMLLARESVSLDRSPQTESTLLATLLRSPAAIATFALPIDSRPQRLALSPDGRTLTVSDNNGRVYFYDPRAHSQKRPPLIDHSAPVYSQDGSLIVAFANGNPPFIDVLDAHTLAHVARLSYDRRWLNVNTTDTQDLSLAISPDDRTVYYAYWVLSPSGQAGAAYLDRWSLPSGRLVSSAQIASAGPVAIRLVGSGRRLVVLAGGTASALDARSLRQLHSVKLPVAASARAVVSPDGRKVVVGAPSGLVSFVDFGTGRVTGGVGGPGGAVEGIAFSPDSHLAVSTSSDGKVVVWDPSAARPVEVLSGHAGRPGGIAFSPDGRTLYTCALDGIVIEWDLGSDRRFGKSFQVGPWPTLARDVFLPPPIAVSPDSSTFAVIAGPSNVQLRSVATTSVERTISIPGPLTAIAFSPNGDQVAVAGEAGRVALWSIRGQPHAVRQLAGLGGRARENVQQLAYSGDGRLIAAVDVVSRGLQVDDGRLAVWRASSGTLEVPVVDLGRAGVGVALSPDGRELAVTTSAKMALLVDLPTGRVRHKLTPLGGTGVVAFARDGTLATGSYAGIVQLWNPLSGTQVGHPVLVSAGPVSSLAFDPSGQRFATTGGSDGTAKIWFTASQQQEATALDNVPETWGDAAFTPDGRELVTIHDNGRGYVWPVSLDAWEQHACAVAGRNFAREEWSRFVTGRGYAPVCP